VTSRIVADAGPLIALARIDRLDLLLDIAGAVDIPEAVREELGIGTQLPGATLLARHIGSRKPIRCRKAPTATSQVTRLLGAGESQAIELAVQRCATLLIDERRGRRAARQRGIQVIGTGRILLEAKRRGLIEAVAPVLRELTGSGYHLSDGLVNRLLVLADEAPRQAQGRQIHATGRVG